ncbi:hypothetical protein [Amycolatopsis jiangsuensis]|uniref:Uncharacterized protein n=1 Tax=Amycolatopsis jiangsuensis TaxID=1181879 RepID=A0A840IT73_9PSEU|nr:hypothetical protein [Amycolatopsis jiangsuensis]MBB4684412.1 hypothetical protein [Amycolatopsis jiangsuensis]
MPSRGSVSNVIAQSRAISANAAEEPSAKATASAALAWIEAVYFGAGSRFVFAGSLRRGASGGVGVEGDAGGNAYLSPG